MTMFKIRVAGTRLESNECFEETSQDAFFVVRLAPRDKGSWLLQATMRLCDARTLAQHHIVGFAFECIEINTRVDTCHRCSK